MSYSANEMAHDAQAILDELLPLRDAETDERKRRELSARIKTARTMRRFAMTRVSYVAE